MPASLTTSLVWV